MVIEKKLRDDKNQQYNNGGNDALTIIRACRKYK